MELKDFPEFWLFHIASAIYKPPFEKFKRKNVFQPSCKEKLAQLRSWNQLFSGETPSKNWRNKCYNQIQLVSASQPLLDLPRTAPKIPRTRTSKVSVFGFCGRGSWSWRGMGGSCLPAFQGSSPLHWFERTIKRTGGEQLACNSTCPIMRRSHKTKPHHAFHSEMNTQPLPTLAR